MMRNLAQYISIGEIFEWNALSWPLLVIHLKLLSP